MLRRKKIPLKSEQATCVTKLLLSLIVALTLSVNLDAQMQYNQWAFGWRASYSFSPPTGPLIPAPLITSQQDAASWCDNTGNLTFYTDGRSIFNYTGGPGCTNCLNGNPNSGGGTQGVLILPKIGGPADEFYIFTVSDRGPVPPDVNNGLSYYTFNTTTGVLSAVTSMGITPGTTGSFTTEGLTAIPHANGTDYWIIVKAIATTASWISSPLPPYQPAGASNSSIYAYLVTPAGVSPNPVISDANYSIIVSGTNAGANAVNEIKCSPDGRYMCMTNRTSSTTGSTNLFRFNSTTGNFTFLQTLPMLSGYAPIGSSFSPNSRVLYVCGSYPPLPGPIPGDEVLRQYDLKNLNCDPFTAVPFCDYNTPVPFSSPASFNTQLQLTPDGRIFRTRYASQFVDVIGSPNNVGCTSIGYVANGIQVANVSGNTCRHSFPNNIDAQPGPPPVDEWPKTSMNTVNVDKGVATDVDETGNVYSCGTFNQSTQFESTVITGGAGSTNSYLVKYDDCDGLKWVARITSANWVECHSMDVGENVDRVFVTGRYIGGATFSSGVGGSLPCPGPISVSGNGIFIAIYNYDGCLLNVHTIPDDPTYTHMSAHVSAGRAYSPFTGLTEDRVYVAINETTIGDDHMRIFAFKITGSSLTSWWIAPLRSSPSAQINDIASYGTTLAVTGSYDRDIFWNTDMTSFATTPTGVPEAFVATLQDVNGSTNLPTKITAQTRGFDPGTGGASTSSGSGVCFSGSSVFLTGTYTGTNTSAFGTGSAMAGNGTNTCGYVARLDMTGTGWGHTFSSDGPVVGIDIAARTGSGAGVYCTGIWENDSVFNIDNTAMPAIVPMKRHMYVVKILLNGTYTGAGCWQNHSYMNNDLNQYMKPARIAQFSNRVYVNGSYMGTGRMYSDGAFNSPLTSTTGTFNSFVWRYSEVVGTSFREAQETAGAENTVPQKWQPVLFPNPVQNTLNIQLPESDASARIEIYSASGQLMTSLIASSSGATIDVSQWAMGIYFVRIESEGQVATEKFIRN